MVGAAVGSNGDSDYRHSLVANILGNIYTAHDGLPFHHRLSRHSVKSCIFAAAQTFAERYTRSYDSLL
jgi:hypothetical protein